MPRYLPIQTDAATEQIRDVYLNLEKRLDFVPNFIKTMAHSPNYLKPVAELYQAVLGETTLHEKIRELVVLKTCKINKCKYTTEIYRERARNAGWTDEHLEAMDDYAKSELFAYYEKEALKLAELVTQRPDDISQDQFWTQLDNHFTSDQVVEMITLIGFYNMINRLILALEIEPDKKAGAGK